MPHLARFALACILAVTGASAQSASIKPGHSEPGIGKRFGPKADGGIATINLSLRHMILIAWDLRAYQLVGGPDWIDSPTFNISTTSDTHDPAQAQTELRTLLVTRFGLRFHRETRSMPIYTLKPVHNGEGPGDGVWLGVATPSDGGRTLAQFAGDLSGSLDRLVVDGTNVAGKYDLLPNSAVFPLPVITPPDIGLKLDSQEGPVEMFIIDGADKPSLD